MAMNKAEKAYVAELEAARALCWPCAPEPTPLTIAEIKAARETIVRKDRSVYRSDVIGMRGWFFNAYDKGTVTLGWSDGNRHWSNGDFADISTREAGRMYRTREEAALALRHELSRRYAQNLARVDRIIRGEAE